MSYNYFSKNGQLLPLKDAVIPLSSIEYSYGFGVYENIRVSGGIIYFLSDHIDRLVESAKIIGLEHTFSKATIEENIRQLTIKNDANTCNVKVLLIGAADKVDAQLIIMCLNPLFPDRKLYRDGVDLTSYTYERAFPHAKTLNMLQSYLAYAQARRVGAYDALLIDHDGNIAEGTRTNFFAIKDQVIYSPPEEDILLGVTRKVLLKVALDNGYKVTEKSIKLEDVDQYDALFISSTSSKILPVRSIDGTILPQQWESLKSLMSLFDNFLTASNGKL